MEIGLQRVSAIVIILGAVMITAALPVSFRVFPEPSPTRKLQSIEASPTTWSVAQVLFALGATLTVVGIALLAHHFRDMTGPSHGSCRPVSESCSLAYCFWMWHLYGRAVDPAAFAAGALPVWPLADYFVSTEAGLALYGVALLRTGLPAWVGWMVIGSMALFFVMTLFYRDMVPAVYYLVTLLTAVMLYR